MTLPSGEPAGGKRARGPPVVNGGDPLLDTLGVDVAVAGQPPAGLHYPVDLVLAGVHGGHEVLLLLDGGLGALQSAGQLRVS